MILLLSSQKCNERRREERHRKTKRIYKLKGTKMSYQPNAICKHSLDPDWNESINELLKLGIWELYHSTFLYV